MKKKKRLTVNTLALGNLKNRRKQYAVLIIGIILAMVFSAGTVFFLDCYMTSKEEFGKQKAGIADYAVGNVDKDKIEEGIKQKVFSEIGYAHILGYGFNSSDDEDMGVAVGWLDETAEKLAYHTLLEGRYPEKDGEIAVEKDALISLNAENVQIGSEIKFNNFKTADGNGFSQESKEKTYTLVGILADKRANIKRESSYAEQIVKIIPAAYVCPNTLPEPGGKESLTAYAVYYDTSEDIYSRMFDFFDSAGINYEMSANIDIVRMNTSYSFGMGDNNFVLMVFFSIILMLVSCLVIVNSFNTNLRSRRTQIGLLRAVGTTRRQIIRIFGRETFIISLVCAPISLVISYAVTRLAAAFLDNFIFKPRIWILFVCVFAGVICVMLAALIPLISASKITPMQAIRNMEYSRKMKKYKVKSQTQYKVSSLLVKRNNMFNKGKRAFVCILLTVTIVASCFGFEFVDIIKNSYYDMGYDYQLRVVQSMGIGDHENIIGRREGFSENDRREIFKNPYVKEASGAKSCSINIVCDEIPEYMKIIDSFDYYSYDNQSAKPTKDSIKKYFAIPSFTSEVMEKYGFSRNLIALRAMGIFKSDIEKLKDYVREGRIDINKLNSGEEVLLVMPEKYYLYGEKYSNNDPGWFIGSAGSLEDRMPTNREITVLDEQECCYHAGDVLDLAYLGSDYYSENGDISESENLTKKEKQVKVGAVIGSDYYKSGIDLYFFSDHGLITTVEGMNQIDPAIRYENININLKTDVTEDVNENIMAVLNKIASSSNGSDVFSDYEYKQTQDAEVQTLFIGLLAIVILFFCMAGSIINNSMTAQIRESKKAIGTLRAVGASERELVKIYIGQTASVFAYGYGIGFALYFVIYATAYLVSKSMDLSFDLGITVWRTLIMCAVLFAVCAVNLSIQTKKLMKYSIVENIREL